MAADGRDAGREAARREIAVDRRAAGRYRLARLGDAMRAIDGARSLTEVLDALLTAASREASGAGLAAARGTAASLAGNRRDRDQPPDVQSLDTAGHPEAARRNATAQSDALLAVPIAIAGRSSRSSPPTEPAKEAGQPRVENLELLARYAAKTLEALTAFKTARALTQRPEPPPRSRRSREDDAGCGRRHVGAALRASAGVRDQAVSRARRWSRAAAIAIWRRGSAARLRARG